MPQTMMNEADLSALILFDDGHVRPIAAIRRDIVRLAAIRLRGNKSEIARRLKVRRATLRRREQLGK